MSSETGVSDWKAGITFECVGTSSFEVISKCPDLHFPAEFLAKFDMIHKGLPMGRGMGNCHGWTRPDGQSEQGWIDNIRPYSLTVDKSAAYGAF